MRESIRRVKLAGATVILLLACAFVAGAAFAKTGIRTLDEGLAQFALDTGRNALALWYLGDSGSSAPVDKEESENALLIQAQALLNTGQTERASLLLDHLMKGDYFRGHAALLKASLVEDAPEERERLLLLAANKSHEDVRQRALFERADAARAADQPDRAGGILASMDPGYWAALGYMNIAAHYATHDRTPSRALVSLRVAMAMSEADTNRQRAESLSSQLLVRAGHLAYQHDDYDKAISFLEKLPLESYSTPQGLYLHGLALSAKGNQRGAMQSWHRAKKFPLAYPGVAESWLGTGRGYDLAGYLGQAGEAYLAASASYESERVTSRKLAELVREKGAYEALLTEQAESEAEWFLADRRMLTQPISAYLLRFMEDPASQRAVLRVKELRSLRLALAGQRTDFGVFRDVINDQIGSSISANLPANYQDTVKKLTRWVDNRMAQSPSGSPASAELKMLNLILADLELSATRLPGRLDNRDKALQKTLRIINSAMARIDRTETRIDSALTSANAELDEKVLAFVASESQRMVAALEKANQQIAHLYEYLALQNVSRRAQ